MAMTLLAATSTISQAGPVGFDFFISGGPGLAGREDYLLINTSTSALFTSIEIGITDGFHSFDCVADLEGGTGAINGTDGDCFNTNLFSEFKIDYHCCPVN